MNTQPFTSLALAPRFLANLATLGYHGMTPIQAASLPAVLEGRDLIAQAKTGSGKTAAFGIGVLHKLHPAWFAVQGLVLCPTRELADQVANELRRLARGEGNIKVLALTGDAGLTKEQVGKINVFEFMTYVALDRHAADQAFRRLNAGNQLGPDFGNIKGRSFKMRFIEA